MNLKNTGLDSEGGIFFGWNLKIEYLLTGLEVFGYFGQFGHYSQLPIECSECRWYDDLDFFVLCEENQWKWSCECTGYQEQKEAYITCQAEKRLDIVLSSEFKYNMSNITK